MNYDKGKERKPLETVKNIKSILSSVGIKTKVKEFNNNNVFSCRVYADSIFVGQNGKGTTKEYSLASGYAEFIERIQNEVVADMQPSPVDCVELLPQEMSERCLSIYKYFGENADVLSVIDLFNRHFDRTESKKVKCAPFFDVKNSKVEHLPLFHILRFTGSNGMCAGNSPSEAIVQGIYELFERYVHQMVLRHNYVLPIIPQEEYLKYDKINAIIKEFEKFGYNVQLRDGSLGQGFPVVCLIITNKSGKYSIKFSSQYCLPVAVERTLTELLQGLVLKNHDLDRNAVSYSVESHWDNLSTEQKVKLNSACKIFVPGKFFTNRYSWEYSPETFSLCDVPNSQALEKCLDLISQNDFDLYVRDVSFLGFPSYFLFIPQISVYDIKIQTAKEFMSDRETLIKNGDKKTLNILDLADDLGGHKMSFSHNEWFLAKKYIKHKVEGLTDDEIYASFSFVFGEDLTKSFFKTWVEKDITPENIHTLQDELLVKTKDEIKLILSKYKQKNRIDQNHLKSVFN